MCFIEIMVCGKGYRCARSHSRKQLTCLLSARSRKTAISCHSRRFTVVDYQSNQSVCSRTFHSYSSGHLASLGALDAVLLNVKSLERHIFQLLCSPIVSEPLSLDILVAAIGLIMACPTRDTQYNYALDTSSDAWSLRPEKRCESECHAKGNNMYGIPNQEDCSEDYGAPLFGHSRKHVTLDDNRLSRFPGATNQKGIGLATLWNAKFPFRTCR
jgi:hypothetical protein